MITKLTMLTKLAFSEYKLFQYNERITAYDRKLYTVVPGTVKIKYINK